LYHFYVTDVKNEAAIICGNIRHKKQKLFASFA